MTTKSVDSKPSSVPADAKAMAGKKTTAGEAEKKSPKKSSHGASTMEELLASTGYTLKGLKKGDAVYSGEFPTRFNVLGALDVFGRREMIHHEDNLFLIPYAGVFDLF